MSIEQTLISRSESKCELCSSSDNLTPYEVPASENNSVDEHIYICKNCREQIENPDSIIANHWRCLNDSMWSHVPAVQVMAWRMLKRLSAEGWPQELLEIMYLEDNILAWAKAAGDGDVLKSETIHTDCHGAVLAAGDHVTLIKDLKVKGANFTAKQGTAVRGISLVLDNPEHIEGKVEGQRIVILTKFVKKSA